MAKTYLQSCLRESKIIRWADHCFPLAFYIAPFRWYKAQNEGYKYQSIVRRALETWERATNGKVKFRVVQTLNESQINLDWKRIDRKALGHCYFHFDNSGRLYSAEVQIGLSDGIIHAQYQDENEVYHTILHEIGHALGLGHSPYTEDIMYTPHRYGVINLSPNDIATMQWLYRLPYGASVHEISQKYKIPSEDLDYIIQKYINNGIVSGFEEVKNSVRLPQKDLIEEQQKLAELKKYNLGIQNIQISTDIQQYIRKTLIDKDIKKP